MRRNILLILLFFALPVAAKETATEPVAQTKQPIIRFLSQEDGRKALTEGTEQTYYENLHLSEMRAKTGLSLDVPLDEARRQTRQHYADEVQEFSIEERMAITGVLLRMQPMLKAKLSFYTRLPWSFIKVSTQVEGGLPHTRGAHIVFSPLVPQAFADYHRANRHDLLDAIAVNPLVHEQTHVLQRRQPELFASLYTDVFGFHRMSPAPTTPWLLEHHGVNPDVPDTGWAFPIKEGANVRWIMPYLTLRLTEMPRMPRDFLKLAVTVEETEGRWVVAGHPAQPHIEDLSSVKQYNQAFPTPAQAYHPNEIAADLIDHWASGAAEKSVHPVVLKTIA